MSGASGTSGAASPRLSIKDLLHSHVASADAKTWNGHDRLSTVGASEVGQCLRKTWFSKNEAPADPSYVDRYGARLRGTLLEEHYWVPALRASLGPRLLFAGEEQQTLVDGYLSATPDGLISGLPRDCLAWLGIDDIGPSTCILAEAKSIDPRVDLHGAEKPEHSFQTQAQMGLVRHATLWKPEVALISYIDASFLDDVKEFAVRFDPNVYQAAKDRATRVMTSAVALDLPAEGKLSGGKECNYCPWASHCANVTVAGLPSASAGAAAPQLGDNAVAELKALRDAAVEAAAAKDVAEQAAGAAQEAIKGFLRQHDSRGHKDADGWAVAWSSVKGRVSVDVAAATAAGVDLSAFQKTGEFHTIACQSNSENPESESGSNGRKSNDKSERRRPRNGGRRPFL